MLPEGGQQHLRDAKVDNQPGRIHYLTHRQTLSRARGLLFLSESRRNWAASITFWTWSKVDASHIRPCYAVWSLQAGYEQAALPGTGASANGGIGEFAFRQKRRLLFAFRKIRLTLHKRSCIGAVRLKNWDFSESAFKS